MSARARLLGAVLAGGEGRRFGAPKAEARVGGASLVARAVAALRGAVEDVVVVTSRPLADPPAPVVPDRVRSAGPLGGLDAALHEARVRGLDGVVLVACDLPLLTGDVVARLVASLGAEAAVAPEREGGGVEPLCAVYRGSVAAAVAAGLASEDRSLHALFRAVGGRVVPLAALGPEAPRAFLNVNTPGDRDAAERALAGEEAG